ncbi:P-II family nitrogen regulator [Desulfurivibrio alkaliphilus]|uniref:PII family protein n=1 Tax=Desulfurivibrio alkaliphilus (strain DSM 19089 / UNIQEM U267 / AHT2) TaxID=589865 RepID=D6Z543_DESAT|nr:P-II family nitrogen regulator [Desulfurivibrio alkaliphilus]ADH86668.1 PII family protein [Desulfurivibrio alkaliphilus AHT 2]
MNHISCYKLLITVVRKGRAKTIVKASKEAGAEGGTTFIGKGIGIYEKKFWGIPVNQDKEIVFTLFPEKIIDPLFNAVTEAGRLEETGQGIALVIDVTNLAGIAHFCDLDAKKRHNMQQASGFELIVTVVNKGNSEAVVSASKRAGAEGGTILYGRGTGIHEKETLFSIPIEPEKEVVLTLIAADKTEAVLQAIRQDTGLDEPGRGIAFVLPVDKTTGIKRLEAEAKSGGAVFSS